MLLLTNFTNAANQQAEIILPDNSTFILQLQYDELVSSWFYSVVYSSGNFNCLGQKLTTNLNLLSNFINLINFGILCNTSGGGEPWYLDDFSSGRVSLYLLNEADIREVQTIYNTSL